jgi:predicted peptidase
MEKLPAMKGFYTIASKSYMKPLFLWVIGTVLLAHDISFAGEDASKMPVAKSMSVQDFSTTERCQYLLFLPKGYDANGTNRWPVILFLHGIGESGTNIWRTTLHGPVQFIEKHSDFPFILISPQCPVGQKWSDQIVLGILSEVESKYAVDTNRVYLTGLSMGGFGVWSLATTYPEKFAAVAPISGGGDTMGLIICTWNGKAQILKSLPFWAFHCKGDPIVSVSESKRMVDALKKYGCKDVKLTIYPQAQHDAWTKTYDSPQLYEWLLKYKRGTGT